MDKSAVEYAQLLSDPCNAKLVHGIFPGTTGGIVSRFEVDYIFNSSATDIGAVAYWLPGVNMIFSNSAAITSDFQALVPTYYTFYKPPGFDFLSTTAGSFRTVAACMQLSYPGSELNRAGVASLGICDTATLLQTLPVANGGGGLALNSLSTLRQTSQHTERTPAACMELLFSPGDGDARNFTYGTVTSSVPQFPNNAIEHEGRNAMFATVSGIPVSTGIRFRFVLVCEWTPRAAQGLVASITPSFSNQTVNNVLAYLDSKDPKWYIKASYAMGSVMSNMVNNKMKRLLLN